MVIKEIDANVLAQCFMAGAGSLISKKDLINELNVFPVPDGDTGTNMSMTITGAAKEVAALGDDYKMKDVCKAISNGSLKGARGNSGVILSQLLRGFTRKVQDCKTIDLITLSEAMTQGVDTAYKAVMKPKEGTILTVARAAADKAEELIKEDPEMELSAFCEQVFEYTRQALANTPELLPVLKEAGVVDSGGQGLLEVFRGALNVIQGKEVSYDFELKDIKSSSGAHVNKEAIANADIKFGYCTEFIIKLDKEFNEGTERSFKAYLESIGDSIVCVSMDDIVKVHVHTDHPGQAFEKALNYGQLTNMKVDNMREEHNERLFNMGGSRPVEIKLEEEKKDKNSKTDEKKEYGFVSVSVGDGLKEIFEALGCDCIIEGGQTMNPSTDDILSAVDKVNADTVFILPNNSNIILSANQAAALSDGKQVIVLPTKSIPEGICALINFIPEHDTDDNIKEIMQAVGQIKTGQVTYSVRDTTIDGQKIKAGDYMGLGNHTVMSVDEDMEKAAEDLIGALIDQDSELVTVYCGNEVSDEQADALKAELEDRWGEVEFEFHNGGQPVYYYIISVE
ncbi:MAG: DAK2 domain-containing protein [Lachnospiraceae bacterium]|nr:DAK2 domain-containing protein [Lachnospiraceae bacterium]